MKKLNLNELCWFLLLGALIVIVGKLIMFDELKYYLHPKMHFLVYAAEGILLILFLFQQRNLFKESKRTFRMGYFLFLIPLFMAVMAGDAGGIIFENRTVNLTGFQQSGSIVKTSQAYAQSGEVKSEEKVEISPVYDMLPEGEMNNPDPEATDPTNPNDIARVDSDPFLTTLFSLGEDAAGKEVELEGFVYRDAVFSEDQFFVSRMLVSCCAADSQLVGLIVQTPLAKNYKDNEWVRVKGVTKMMPAINPYTNEEEQRIVIEVKEIETIEAYETPYVYFSY